MQEYAIKSEGPFKKFKDDFHVTFKRLSKIKPITPCYVPFETVRLLYETFV